MLANERGLVKIIPLILIVVAVGIISFLLISSSAPFSGFFGKLFPKPGSRAASQASITLPTSSTAQQNNTFNVPVMINTVGQDIVGVDVRLNFNKYYLKVMDITPQPANSTLKSFAPTDSSGNFNKSQVIADANNTGIISFGALAFSSGTSSTFNGSLGSTNPLANITFQALNQGSTSVNVSFTSGSNTDSNMVTAQNQDILNQVSNDTVTISGVGTPPPSFSPTPTATPVVSACGGADLDHDGKVFLSDYNILVGNFNKTGVGASGGDIDGDGKVFLSDYNILVGNFNHTGC